MTKLIVEQYYMIVSPSAWSVKRHFKTEEEAIEFFEKNLYKFGGRAEIVAVKVVTASVEAEE